MAEPFVQVFNLNDDEKIASVVMDRSDFNALCDLIGGIMSQDGRIDKNFIENIKDAGHIPMIARGTKTEFIFNKFGVTIDKMSVIVRGKGPTLLKSMLREIAESN